MESGENARHSDAFAAMLIGGPFHGTTVEEMTAAYAVFDNGGKYYKPWTSGLPPIPEIPDIRPTAARGYCPLPYPE